jgi:endonuclease/exonuclease/phosphatase family metal-dependent hydrolase
MEISVITSNVSADFLTPSGVPTWEDRKWLYVQVLRDADPSLIGLQEVTPRQLQFLQAQLPEFTALTVPVTNPDPDLLATWQAKYARFGLPQIPSPYEIILFYRTDLLEPRATGHWWLSPTPDRPSIGFGNTAPRVMLWAHLRHRVSSHELLIVNTHIDHRCPRAMVDLCREKFAVCATPAASLIFMGDLNFNPSDSNYALLIHDGWRDSHEATAAPDSATFLYNLPDIPGGRLDHILYRGDGLTPRTWARLVSPDPERRVSDHDPVHARFSVD